MNSIESSIILFNAVIAQQNSTDNYYINYKRGIVISPDAVHEKENILKVIDNIPDLNNTSFYKSWNKCKSVTLQERLIDQILHYFTTAINSEYIYFPTDELSTLPPENLRLKVIRGLSREQLIDSCFRLLQSSVALKSETLDHIFNVLAYCDYNFTGNEKIANREAISRVADLTGILPKNGDDLFRYIIYKATSETLIIKNEELIQKIKNSQYELNLTVDQVTELSRSFHRHKPLWMAFKFNKHNSSIVNKISKLAKNNHVPMQQNVLNSLTSKIHNKEEIIKSLNTANVFQIIRAINAINYYSLKGCDRYYRIRNGKSYAKRKQPSLGESRLLETKKILLSALRDKVKNKKVFIPDFIDYAAPTSEKLFVGNVPVNSRITVPYDKSRNLLIGVYWKNSEEHSDLDLSAINITGKIGWNSGWVSNELTYSGDVTSAFNGASEWLYCQELKSEFLIKLNAYYAPDEQDYKLIIGYGDKIDRNYIIDPNNILFSVDCVMNQNQKVLGLLSPNENNTGVEFHLIDQSFGQSIVSSLKEKDIIAQAAILSQVRSCLKLKDILNVVNNKDDAEIMLDPNDLQKDTILKLL